MPNNSIISGETTLKDAIQNANSQAFSQLENNTLDVNDVIKSVSAFGINIDEEVSKINSGTSDYIDINNLSNSGHISNNFFGGGGEQNNEAANNASGNVSNITGNINTDSNPDSTTMEQYSELLVALCALNGLSIGVSAAQIVIDIAILALSAGFYFPILADMLLNASSIAMSTLSLIEANEKLNNLNDLIKDSNDWIVRELLPYLGRDISNWAVYHILKYEPKIFLKKMNVPAKYIESLSNDFYHGFSTLRNSPVYAKLVQNVNPNYFKIIKLSIVSTALSIISVAIDTITTIISGIIKT